MVAEGLDIVRECLRRNRPGPYQLQAAINAVHDTAARAEPAADMRLIFALLRFLFLPQYENGHIRK